MLPATTASQRSLVNVPASLSWQPVDGDGVPALPGGVVTVTVRSSDGTVLVAAAATSGSATAPRTYTLAATATAVPDLLTVYWYEGGVLSATTQVEIVGGYYFSVADLRAAEPSLADASRDTTDRILIARAEVESLFEDVLGYSCVPRFDVCRTMTNIHTTLPNMSTLPLDRHPLRAVRWVRQYTSPTAYTVFTPTQLANIPTDTAGVVRFFDGYTGWYGLEVGYEHGLAAPPPDVKAAAMTYARYVVNRKRSGVSDRAVSMTSPEGTSYQFGRVGTKWRPTGIEAVDEVLLRRAQPVPAIA